MYAELKPVFPQTMFTAYRSFFKPCALTHPLMSVDRCSPLLNLLLLLCLSPCSWCCSPSSLLLLLLVSLFSLLPPLFFVLLFILFLVVFPSRHPLHLSCSSCSLSSGARSRLRVCTLRCPHLRCSLIASVCCPSSHCLPQSRLLVLLVSPRM